MGGDADQETNRTTARSMAPFINYIGLGACVPLPGTGVIGSLDPGHGPVLSTCPIVSGDHLGSGFKEPWPREQRSWTKAQPGNSFYFDFCLYFPLLWLVQNSTPLLDGTLPPHLGHSRQQPPGRQTHYEHGPGAAGLSPSSVSSPWIRGGVACGSAP